MFSLKIDHTLLIKIVDQATKIKKIYRPGNVLTAKSPDHQNREIFDRQISDCQIPNRQISDRPLSPTGGVNPRRVSPLRWDRHLSCHRDFQRVLGKEVRVTIVPIA